MSSQTIGRQIRNGFLAALAITLVLALAAGIALIRVAQVQDDVVEHGLRLVLESRELENLALERAVHVRGFVLTGDESAVAAIEAADLEMRRVQTTIANMARRAEALRLVADIEELDRVYRETVETVIEARRDGEDLDALEQQLRNDLFPARDELDAAVEALAAFEENVVDEGVRDARAARTWALVVFGLLAAAAIAVTGLMTRRIIRRTTGALGEVSLAIDGATSEILTSNSQQVSGAAEQAASIQETVTTVDELAQSANETTRRAREVVAKTEESARTAEEGSSAVEGAQEGMAAIRDQVNTIAETILALAHQAQSISGIIDTVDDIAEQTNLLALNAAIEAARAGEQGRGFSVVAAEIRDLADQSKRATGEIGGILGEIQDATNKAVMATEEGTQGATAGMALVSQAGATISSLARAVEDATVAAEQIAAAAEQQAGATGQISVAMTNVRDVMEQNLSTARQSEQTARDLQAVAERLKALVGAA